MEDLLWEVAQKGKEEEAQALLSLLISFLHIGFISLLMNPLQIVDMIEIE